MPAGSITSTALKITAAQIAHGDAGIVPQSDCLKAMIEAAVVIASVRRVSIDYRRLNRRLSECIAEIGTHCYMIAAWTPRQGARTVSGN